MSAHVKTSMPHLSLDKQGLGGYDALLERLAVVDFSKPCPDDPNGKEACLEQRQHVLERGFTKESWQAYRDFMVQNYGPDLRYNVIARKVMDFCPVWDRIGNKLVGYFNRKTGDLVSTQAPPVTAKWILRNCRFGKQKRP